MKLSNKVKAILGVLALSVVVAAGSNHKEQPSVEPIVANAPIEQAQLIVQEPAVNPYQDRILKPLKYVVYYHEAGAFEIVDNPAEDKAISLWDACQAEDVATPGDVKIWDSKIGQCMEIPEWRATNVNKVVNEYRESIEADQE